jgi:hypothetical protein
MLGQHRLGRWVRESTLNTKGYTAVGSKVIALFVSIIFLGSGYASSDCVVGKITTCSCDGRTESYAALSDELQKAINNPSSCCYSHKVEIMAYLNTPVYGFILPPEMTQGPQQTIKVEQIVNNKSFTVSTPQMSNIPVETEIPFEIVNDSAKVQQTTNITDFQKQLIIAFLSVFQPHLQNPSQISIVLFS